MPRSRYCIGWWWHFGTEIKSVESKSLNSRSPMCCLSMQTLLKHVEMCHIMVHYNKDKPHEVDSKNQHVFKMWSPKFSWKNWNFLVFSYQTKYESHEGLKRLQFWANSRLSNFQYFTYFPDIVMLQCSYE